MHETEFDLLERLLAVRRHRTFTPGEGIPAASVALLLRPAAAGSEVLLIRRAEHPGDPWSGHMALPGGRTDPGDADEEATAVRETREEVGIDLQREGRLLGRLDQIRPVAQRAPKVLVSPFVYAVGPEASAVPNPEVALALWVPVAELASPAAVTEFLYELEDGSRVAFPAYGAGDHVIWGLTYRILTGFIRAYHDAVGHREWAG